MHIHGECLWKSSVGVAAFAQKYEGGSAALSLGLDGQQWHFEWGCDSKLCSLPACSDLTLLLLVAGVGV